MKMKWMLNWRNKTNSEETYIWKNDELARNTPYRQAIITLQTS